MYKEKNRRLRYVNIIFGIAILCSIMVNIHAGLLFLFLLLVFFMPALIIAFVLIFKKTIGLVAAVFLFILGAAYSLIPLFPGPPIWLTSIFGSPEFSAQDLGNILLLASVYSAKLLSLISGLYVLISAIALKFKK